ncbi:MAG: ORF6N domain-containing protein [Paludibacteraceae bacterium]|nr:ORF6N domain-containing protein [Paludibacteraceae bacterium]
MPKAGNENRIQDSPVTLSHVESRIMTIRGTQVMLDSDIAELYGVETKRLNEAVKRNIQRFPESFMFRLNRGEVADIRSQIATSCSQLTENKHVVETTLRAPHEKRTANALPYCFTEQGVAMLSAILHTPTAIRVSVQIMNAFVQMRHLLVSNTQVLQRLETIEHHQLAMAERQEDAESKIEEVFRRLDEKLAIPTQGVFYEGQIFDAYVFVSELIEKTKQRVILIDNYVNSSVLTMLDKRGNNVQAAIYTATISEQLKLDMVKHNAQYQPIEIFPLKGVHDRFLIIDHVVYHIGASLKDLGKKCFAFSKLNDLSAELLLSKINPTIIKQTL